MRIRSSMRRGYTLLEVMLASLIAMLLMAALYVSIDTQLRQMEEGRNRVEHSTLSRALFQRITADLTPSIGPGAPPVTSASPSSTPQNSNQQNSNQQNSTQQSSSSSTPTDTGSTQESLQTPIQFSVGVKGESDHVSIFLSRLNRAIITPTDDGSGNTAPATSDVTRITYFLDSSKGLCRQEILQATSELVDNPPDGFVEGDDQFKIVAAEVKQFEIRYYDGSSWVNSWDGSTPGPDGKTPQGPPRAIEITIGLQAPNSDRVETFRHTICFPTAPGPSTGTGTTEP